MGKKKELKNKLLKYRIHGDDSSDPDSDSPEGKYLKQFSRKQGGFVRTGHRHKYYTLSESFAARKKIWNRAKLELLSNKN